MALDNIDELNVKNASPFPTALRYGAIGALLMIVIGLIQYLIGIASQSSQALGWLSLLAVVVFPVLAIRTHRDNDLGGYISYGRGLGTGVLTVLVMSLIGVIWAVALYYFIDPTIPEQLMQVQAQAMEEQGMSDDDIENAMEMIGKFMTPEVLIAIGTGMSFVLGLITSLLASAGLKKDRADA